MEQVHPGVSGREGGECMGVEGLVRGRGWWRGASLCRGEWEKWGW